MKMKNSLFAAFFAAALSLSPFAASAFDITGGPSWENREGPGFLFSAGLNACLRDYCDDNWDTGVSAGGTVGFFYRVIPNLVLLAEVHMGHLPVDAEVEALDDDNAFVFQGVGGLEFHLPLADWAAPYAGFAMGFAYLGVWGDIKLPFQDDSEFHGQLRGLDMQVRFGVDFFPFSSAPLFSIGPLFYISFPHWITMCQEYNDENEKCNEPDDDPFNVDDDDLPYIIYFGISAKPGF